ncbi:cyclic electron transport protein PGR5 [Lusitaniella coriacea]|uniref:cyclic electron transport protein PGR5 n=1 Tax=Lusitaniella coriacea TaxID=1983105 RepID=UPI003CFAC0A7
MFAPIVIGLRNQIGKAQFNQLRGKAIALHCKTITNFCNRIGVTPPERQKLIRIARDNGKSLGLLA